MKISDIITEGPVGAVGSAAGGVANTLGKATGFVAGTVPAAAKQAVTGFKAGYGKMDKALKGVGQPNQPKDASDVDREKILNRALAGQMLNYSDVEAVKLMIKGIQDGSIKTNQNPEYLIKGLNSAVSGKGVPANLRPSVEAFRDEA